MNDDDTNNAPTLSAADAARGILKARGAFEELWADIEAIQRTELDVTWPMLEDFLWRLLARLTGDDLDVAADDPRRVNFAINLEVMRRGVEQGLALRALRREAESNAKVTHQAVEK